MSPCDPTAGAPAGDEQPRPRQGLLEQLGFRIHLTFPDLIAIDPEAPDE